MKEKGTLTQQEAKWIKEHSNDPLKYQILCNCHHCSEPADYEIIDDRFYLYHTSSGKRLCKQCWKWGRFLGLILDHTIYPLWTLLRIVPLKIFRFFRNILNRKEVKKNGADK